jgi:hypothetical protein
MSDMSRVLPLPTAPDHQHHDALLVAQFAAGDPLDGAWQAEAQRLVSTCGACAALVADMRAVSMAVAREPAPRRRRDFRLTQEQAEELSGNALSRLLRGLSLPRARVFQPAAAGVLSIGLAFVVAGYAWPDDGAVVVQAEPNTALEQPPVAASPMAETRAPAPAAAGAGADDPALRAEPDAVTDEVTIGSADPEFFEELAEHQAGTSARSNQKSVEVDDLVQPERAKSAAAAEAELEDSTIERDSAFADQDVGEAFEPPLVGSVAADDGNAGDLAAREEAVSEAPAEAGLTTDDDDLASTLILLGLLLALGGGGLLLLGWLARRTSDPLLR